MKTLFVINPTSGRLRRDGTIIQQVEKFSKEWREENDIAYTKSPKHATQLATQAVADGYHQIVAVGGDGTLNEIAHVLVGSDITLGIIPCGSGNGLARSLQIPLDISSALRLLAKDSCRIIDTGVANGIPFLNVMGLGFDAHISQLFNRLIKRGFGSYLKLGIRTYFKYRAEDYLIRSNGDGENVTAFLIAIANSPQYGNNASIAPTAELDDGLLDLVVVPPVGLPKTLILAGRLFTGTITGSKSIDHRQSESFEIETSRPTIFHADGEVFNCENVVRIDTRPKSLTVRSPNLALSSL